LKAQLTAPRGQIEPIDPGVVARLRRASLAAALFSIAVGVAVLLGWWTGSVRLQSVFLGSITMKTNTALALLMAGTALLMLQGAPSRLARAGGGLLSVAVALLGLLTLGEHLSGYDFGIDEMLFVEPPGSPATSSPNRMGPPAAVSFTLLGMALLGVQAKTRGGARASKALALGVSVIAVLPLIGYLLDQEWLFGVAGYTGIALATALGLSMLAPGILLARPERGFTRLLCRSDTAGPLARRLLVPAVLLPVSLGWAAHLGQRRGWYDASFGASLVVLAFIIVFTALVWRNAADVGREAEVRARAEESERAARLEAERANRLKDEFLATLSHELRTPLNSIVGWAHLLQAGRNDPATVARAVEVINRSAKMQAQIIGDILDVSRIVTGQLQLDRRAVDIASLMHSAVETVQPAAEGKRIRLEVSVDPAAGALTGDAARLQQVLWNLLSNAIKFTPVEGRVDVRVRAVGTDVVIMVEDNGPGIPPEFLPFVFDRFRQADSSSTRSHAGLGLGLAIVRHLVELHGGTVKAANAAGHPGALFTVTLPGRTGAQAAGPPPAGPIEQSVSLKGVRVLVVDDSQDALDLAVELLRRSGAEVFTATSAAEGMQTLLSQRPDVVLADIEMPGEDGFGFIRSLRAQEPGLGGATPAIALTAYAAAHDRVRTLMAGFDLHIAKPLPPMELLAAVARLAGRAAPTATARLVEASD
jgi:signal transduction histidine kinase/CheY-like chemotaxis protein